MTGKIKSGDRVWGVL